MHFMKRTFLFLLVFISCLFIGAGLSGSVISAGTAPIHRLVVLHTNDTHGHPAKFDYYPAKEAGGLPARATLINRIRAENKNVLVLDAGDLNTGRPESNLFKAKPDIEGYNLIGYDAMALGNHEFDNPLSVLEEQMRLAGFPFLSANIRTKEGRYPARPYIIKDFNGFKTAILGLTTKSTAYVSNPAITGDLLFEDEVEAAGRWVPELRKKADIVIALVHMGLYDSGNRGSKRLARQVEGIDLIVDGHTHTRLDAPVWAQSGSGRRVPIVQAWQWGLVLGRVDLKIRNKEVIGLDFQAIPINLKEAVKRPDGLKDYRYVGKKIAEDVTLAELLKPYVAKTNELLSEVIGTAEKTFSRAGLKETETALGNMVADAMLWETQGLKVDFAIQNGGGIRADLPGGRITKALIHEILPFDNTVMVLNLKGSDIKDLFAFIGAIKSGSGAFPQVSRGCRFKINRETGKCEDVRINGLPVDPGKIYKVATNSYMAMGGDGYGVFLRALDRYDTSRFQRDVVISYIKHLGGRVSPMTEERIIVTGLFYPAPFTGKVRLWQSTGQEILNQIREKGQLRVLNIQKQLMQGVQGGFDVGFETGLCPDPGQKGKGPEDLEISLKGDVGENFVEGPDIFRTIIAEEQEVMPVGLFPLLLRQGHIGVNQQGGKVICERAQTAALPVDDSNVSVRGQNIPGLEVPVEKKTALSLAGCFSQVIKYAIQLR
ncbi:MAG: 5'-nucleotidase C-terminal domain-containing protein [Pseudomonadota bacterium]